MCFCMYNTLSMFCLKVLCLTLATDHLSIETNGICYQEPFVLKCSEPCMHVLF
jgi:hypothetical protein